MNTQGWAFRVNARCARKRWGKINYLALRALQELTERLSLSVASGDLILINGNWYVTHSGLLRVARRNHCIGIGVLPVHEFCDSSSSRWAFKATVYKTANCKGFVGFGDADASNVSSALRGAELRIAETRAVNRALRKAYGIGICSVEELGSAAPANPSAREATPTTRPGNSNGRPSPQPMRDRLNLLIREHQLDPLLVKRYAADFCGTEVLRDASRELVEDFVATLSKKARENLSGLKCQLNGYQNTEVRP